MHYSNDKEMQLLWNFFNKEYQSQQQSFPPPLCLKFIPNSGTWISKLSPSGKSDFRGRPLFNQETRRYDNSVKAALTYCTTNQLSLLPQSIS